jgi:hypothetical protein
MPEEAEEKEATQSDQQQSKKDTEKSKSSYIPDKKNIVNVQEILVTSSPGDSYVPDKKNIKQLKKLEGESEEANER